MRREEQYDKIKTERREGERSMASSREYLELILGQLSGLEEITHRAMMGEYILYIAEG